MDDQIDNNFIRVLGDVRKGKCIDEMSIKMAEVIEAVKATGKAGKLTLTLDVKPVPNSGGSQVQLLDEVKGKVPVPERIATLFFADDDGYLSRNDPRQRDWVDEQHSRISGEDEGTEPELAQH
jgi:hypothetical protein